MQNHVISRLSLAALISFVSMHSLAGFPGTPPQSLPFGDGALVALAAACVIGVVWLARGKGK